MNMEKVVNHFEREAAEYDSLIPKLTPRYCEQNDIMLKLISLRRSSKIHALDLGCGTGVLAKLILENFPSANVTLFDLVGNMLEVSRGRLRQFEDRIVLRQGNFGVDDFGSGYDIVVFGLAIHHLNNAGKQNLYKRIYHCLNPGGIFLNRDSVLGATPGLSELYHALWREYIKSNGEDDVKWHANYLVEDLPATVEEQLDWLSGAGFIDVGCHWRYLIFAIFGGSKPITLG